MPRGVPATHHISVWYNKELEIFQYKCHKCGIGGGYCDTRYLDKAINLHARKVVSIHE